jgi:hypothetical protein
MNKSYLAIIAPVLLAAIAGRKDSSLNKSKRPKRTHPSQIYSQSFSHRKHWPGNKANSKAKKLYRIQPEFFDIYKQSIADEKIQKHLRQLFTKNQKAQATFIAIVSDFYLRPKFWLDLLHACVVKRGLFSDFLPRRGITIAAQQEKLNPVVLNQFFPINNEIEEALAILKYNSEAYNKFRTRDTSVFSVFGQRNMWELAEKFYLEYIGSPGDKGDYFFFWLLILHSVLADLITKTNSYSEQDLQEILKERKEWIDKNIFSTEQQIRKFINQRKNELKFIDVQVNMGGQELAFIRQKIKPIQRVDISEKNIKNISKRILMDITDNWIFGIKIQIYDDIITVPVVGHYYIARMFKVIKGKTLITDSKGKLSKNPTIMAENWVKQFLEGNVFSTLASMRDRDTNELIYSPMAIYTGRPEGTITLRRTSKEEAIEWIHATHNQLPKFPTQGLLDIIGAYNYKDELMGIMTLNAPAHSPSGEDAPGQYHLVEISRIAVNEDHAGRAVASMLTNWAIENKELYNRSAWTGKANVVTYSMLQESGGTYKLSGMYPTRLSPPGVKHQGTDDVIAETFKIRWESNPYMEGQQEPGIPKVKWYLPKLHRPYVKWTQCLEWDYSMGCWRKLANPKDRKLELKDIQGLVKGKPETIDVDFKALKQLMEVCGAYKILSAAKSEVEILHPKSPNKPPIIMSLETYKNNIKKYKNGTLEKAKQPVLNWINEQKPPTCGNLIPGFKICKEGSLSFSETEMIINYDKSLDAQISAKKKKRLQKLSSLTTVEPKTTPAIATKTRRGFEFHDWMQANPNIEFASDLLFVKKLDPIGKKILQAWSNMKSAPDLYEHLTGNDLWEKALTDTYYHWNLPIHLVNYNIQTSTKSNPINKKAIAPIGTIATLEYFQIPYNLEAKDITPTQIWNPHLSISRHQS